MAHRLGVQEVEASIETLRNYIDWTPFFMTWSLAGKYPRILEDEVVGVEAQRLFKDANDMLDKLSAEKMLNPRGVVGLFPANRVGDDIEIYRDETRTHVINVSHHLRQQTEKPASLTTVSLTSLRRRFPAKRITSAHLPRLAGWKRTHWLMPLKHSMMITTKSW